MSWQSFALTRADEPTRRGFKLVGQLVRIRRQQIGLSQRALERRCGVDQTVISRLENGQLASLRWSRFAQLVASLGGLDAEAAAPSWMSRSLPPRDGAGRGADSH
jgi:transcriptional regulator with XRE-family HTH domain